MDLILYSINDSDNTINKTLVNGLTVNINLKRGVNVITPSIPLADIPGIDLSAFNYASIPGLGRKYFVNQVSNTNGRVWVLELECDVLETYKADILAANSRFTRNIKTGDYFNADIDMSTLTTVQQYDSDVTAFDGEETIILTTLGA